MEMLSRDSVHLSELQRDPNKYVKYKLKKKKTIFLSPEIVKWKSLMLFLLMMMNSVSAGLQVLYFECGLLVFRYIHSNGRYGSARVGVSGPEER